MVSTAALEQMEIADSNVVLRDCEGFFLIHNTELPRFFLLPTHETLPRETSSVEFYFLTLFIESHFNNFGCDMTYLYIQRSFGGC